MGNILASAKEDTKTLRDYQELNKQHQDQIARARQWRSDLQSNLVDHHDWITRHQNTLYNIQKDMRSLDSRWHRCNWWKSLWTSCSRRSIESVMR